MIILKKKPSKNCVSITSKGERKKRKKKGFE